VPTYAVDLHTHTRFFHGFAGRPTAFDPLGARLLGRWAKRRGLDAVAVTNHDYRYDAAADAIESAGVTALPGIEVSTDAGHLLVLGADPPERTEPGARSAREAVALAHDRGCVAVVAHPFRHSRLRHSTAPFDAMECNGKHPATHAKVRAVAERRGLPVTGGSDAHYPFEVGRGYTEVEAPELTPEAVADAVRDGRVAPRYRVRRVDRVLNPLYDRIHRVRGHR
jgi:predicted metal-dependent phosphoesterase TrpH